MTHDVFISYSSLNKTTADAVCHALETNGIRCWIAPRDITGGSTYGGQIMHGIENCKLFLLLFSDGANRSEHVLREIERAVNYRKTILPFRIEDVPMCKDFEYFLGTVHWIDAYPDDTLFGNLITQVARILGKTSTTPVAVRVLSSDKVASSTGKGKYVFPNGDVYEGDYLNGIPHGKGRYTFLNGEVFEGEYLNGLQHGNGRYTHNNGDVFEGEYQLGNPHGKGRYTFLNGEAFEGDYLNGLQHGNGRYTYNNGDVFEGEYQFGRQHGKGKLTPRDGTAKEGIWQNGKFVGSE